MKKVVSSLFLLEALLFGVADNPVNCLPFDEYGNINYNCVAVAPLPFDEYMILTGNFPNLYPYVSISKQQLIINEDTFGAVSYTIVFADDALISISSNPINGTALKNDNTITYIPNPNYHGTDSFSLSFNSTSKGILEKTVSISISSVNDVPIIAINTNIELDEDSNLSQTFTITDVDGDTVLTSIKTNPLHGSVLVDANKVTYTPSGNYNGTDSFTVSFNDGKGGIVDKVINVLVNSVNDKPVASAITISLNEDTSYSGLLIGSDIDGNTLTYSITDNALKGTVTLASDGGYTYQPNANFNGTDSFSFKAYDGFEYSEKATVSITVNAVNDAPTVNNAMGITINENTSASQTFTITDVDGDTVLTSIKTNPLHGSVLVDANKVTYTPSGNYNGTDSFTVSFNDGKGGIVDKVINVLVKNAISLKKGWNLVAIDGNTTDILAKAQFLWQFESGKWKAISNEQSINDTIVASGFNLLNNSLSLDRGTWILLGDNVTFNPSEIKIKNLNIVDGWQLLGTPQDIDMSMFLNKCVDYIWKYDTSPSTPEWLVYINKDIDVSIPAHVGALLKIKANDGFWVKGNGTCQFPTYIDNLPVANINTFQTKYYQADSVLFDASNSTDDFGIVKYTWTDNNIFLSNEKTFQKANLASGTHAIKLTIEDAEGKTANTTASFEVYSSFQDILPMSEVGGMKSISSMSTNGTTTVTLGSGSQLYFKITNNTNREFEMTKFEILSTYNGSTTTRALSTDSSLLSGTSFNPNEYVNLGYSLTTSQTANYWVGRYYLKDKLTGQIFTNSFTWNGTVFN